MSSLTKPNLLLCLDWDGTITKQDTLEILAKTSYGEHSRKHGATSLPPWSHFQDAYMKDYSAHKTAYRPYASDRFSLTDELKWLESLRSVEIASLKRIEAAKVFDGVPVSSMVEAGQELVASSGLRNGLARLLAKASNSNVMCHVLSVNWSKAFIDSAIRNAVEQDGKLFEALDIQCNDLKTNEAETTYTGGFAANLVTAGDKAGLFTSLQKQYEQLQSIYIGDSTSDLPCLMAANVGICIRDGEDLDKLGSTQKSLAETLRRLRIECFHISQCEVVNLKHGNDSKKSKTLFWARDFAEIEEHIFNSWR